MPSLIKQLGPNQFKAMKEIAEEMKKSDGGKDKAPELVADFEEVSKQ